MDACEFCRIAVGTTTAHVVYEDDETMAFLDARPAIEGHTLVSPIDHQESLFALDAPMGAVFETVQLVAQAIETTLEPDGFSLFYTDGDLVGDITHAHVHLLPRYEDDAIHLSLRRERLDDSAASLLVDRLRATLR